MREKFVESSGEMINVEAIYFRFSKDLLEAIGLWPSRQTRLDQLRYALLFGILSTVIVFHFTTFMTAECTLELIVKVLASVFIFINIMIKYSAFWMNTVSIKKLMEQLQRTCGELKDKNEIAIMQKYGLISRRYTILLTASFVCGEFSFISIQCWSSILDIVQPRNESRPHVIVFPMEYFVDQQKYFYLILLHINTAIFIGGITVPATLSVLVSCQECVCGMFTVACYRIEHAMSTDALRNVSLNSKNLISDGIIRAVDIHREAMKLSKFLMPRFEVAFGFLIMAGLSYNVPWYEAPLHVQKLIVFLLQRGTKDFTLSVGGFFNGSMKCFAALANTSISYFTVLYSTQR
ncbi:uncharacterized protein LOC116852030 [Odontomachus brunneus]|uniref:uncharacterized protein LOC116852030 n=1 Tax=Odontomachus brunneus TaxID=486640 RepID=UPI0013F29342|nr:uncharacterized protein LOC116852030 [Odontomachus brunneus]